MVRCEEGCVLLPSWRGRDSRRDATAGEGWLEHLGQLQEEPGFFCGTSVLLSTAPGTSATPKTPQFLVYLQGSREESIHLPFTSREDEVLGKTWLSPKLRRENLHTCKTGLIHLDRP